MVIDTFICHLTPKSRGQVEAQAFSPLVVDLPGKEYMYAISEAGEGWSRLSAYILLEDGTIVFRYKYTVNGYVQTYAQKLSTVTSLCAFLWDYTCDVYKFTDGECTGVRHLTAIS